MDTISCTVEEDRMGNLIVAFENGKTIYLQTENDRAQFGVDCGAIDYAPENWDGQALNLNPSWWGEDFEAITECPEHYQTFAE